MKTGISAVLLLSVNAATTSAQQNPCETSPPIKDSQFCDGTKSYEARAAWIVGQLTLKEKWMLLSTDTGAPVERLGIPAYQWWNEALHGIANSPGVQDSTNATSFPQVILTSSSFNQQLWSDIGEAISTEARALANAGRAMLTYWAPNVNIFRDPRWGRGQETPGEDPFVNAEYAAHFVLGMQGSDDRHLKVSSCCKHYAAYSFENYEGLDRHHFDAKITEQDKYDTFLPPFKSCVVRGKASSIMCSYNSINGIPSCANAEFLTDIARNEWKFDGYITSDCGAIDDILDTHKYYPTAGQTLAGVFAAGMDIECGSFVKENAAQALRNGTLKEEDLTAPLVHLFKVRLRLGQFDPVETQQYTKIPIDVVGSAKHVELALTAARQGIVLLRNDNKILPVKVANVKSLAIVGPHINSTHDLIGNYFGIPRHIVSVEEGLKKYLANAQTATGCGINSTDHSHIAAAVKLAAISDLTILVIGINQDQEGESNDRESIDLPGTCQKALIHAVLIAARGPVITIVISGGTVDIQMLKDSKKQLAVLWAGYPGQEGGNAIAQTIFGDNYPSGRLTQTWYTEAFTSEVEMENMHFRPNATEHHPGRTYRFYRGENVLYTFGYGLTYDEVEIKWGDLPSSLSIVEGESITKSFEVVIKNPNIVSSPQTLLLFISPPNGNKLGSTAPIRSLRSFHRCVVEAKSTMKVAFDLTDQDFCAYDENGVCVPLEGDWIINIHLGQSNLYHKVKVNNKHEPELMASLHVRNDLFLLPWRR